MKSSVIIVLMFVFFCISGFSCQKDVMPSATTTGAGTMGFRVDGVKWVAYSDDFKLSKTGARYWSSSLLEIYGDTEKSRLELSLNNPTIGTYQFSNSNNVRYILFDNFTTTFYLDTTNLSNNLNITRCDKTTISGTFSFKLKSSTGSIVSITSGRFDISIDH